MVVGVPILVRWGRRVCPRLMRTMRRSGFLLRDRHRRGEHFERDPNSPLPVRRVEVMVPVVVVEGVAEGAVEHDGMEPNLLVEIRKDERRLYLLIRRRPVFSEHQQLDSLA
jgi:hypothetical protein